MKHGKILSALLSAAILFGAVLWVPVSGADKALTLKAESRLTLDREAAVFAESTARLRRTTLPRNSMTAQSLPLYGRARMSFG